MPIPGSLVPIYESDKLDIFVDETVKEWMAYIHDKASGVYYETAVANRTDDEIIKDAVSRLRPGWPMYPAIASWYNDPAHPLNELKYEHGQENQG